MIIRGLEAAANGMQALIDQNDSTSNNVANVNTTGYKKQALAFKNIMNNQIVAENHETKEFGSIGELSVGSQVQKLTYDFSQGAITRTDNVFDLAIQGDGFFKVQSMNGDVSYTRNGSFTMNNMGYLVTKDDDYVLDTRNKPIKINTNGVVLNSLKDIIIKEDGRIELTNGTDRVQMQNIGVYDFSNKEDMVSLGSSKFKPPTTNMNPELKAEKFKIEQGSLEMSNVNVVNEMIKTISTSRNYESLAKIVKNSSETLDKVMQVGKL